MKLTYITKAETVSTGGNCMVDVLHLNDGRAIILNDEMLTLYTSLAEFMENGGEDGLLDSMPIHAHPARSEKRKYLAHWGEGFGKPHMENVDLSFFGDGNGYETEQIAQVLKLKLGETADLSDFSGTHTVLRIA